LLFSSCNDGNLDVVSFDFTGVSAKSCNLQKFFIYSIKDKRTFIIEIDEINFKNKVTTVGVPIQVPISGATKVTYREYNEAVNDQTLCSSPPDAGLIRTKEWIATGGTIEITTTAVFDENQTTNASSIASYNHTVVLKNIAFNTGEGEHKNDIIQFGIYNKPNLYKLAIDQTINPFTCGINRSVLYKFIGNQTLTLNVDTAIFDTSVLNTPKIRTTNTTNNKLTYRVLSTGNIAITSSYFCTTTTPFQEIEVWTSQITTGTIQVVTENNAPNGFKHTVKLLNVIMENGSLKFRLGNEYLYGIYSQL
jgi:hypothetical protein